MTIIDNKSNKKRQCCETTLDEVSILNVFLS